MSKINERVWAGQLIAWIHEAILTGTTIFQHASNDEGIKVASGRTKFPDILLFTDKISGIVFNGWELKFPDTDADDHEMLLNALEKAERLKSNSFVTWNGSEAIIWLIPEGKYTVPDLKRLKTYPKEKGITTRNDLSDPTNFRKYEQKLKARLNEILHDLQQLFQDGELKEAINVSDETITAIRETSKFLIPLFKDQINELKGDNSEFRSAFNLWKISESSTLKILSTSSRKVSVVEPEEVLAKFTYYKFIGKIIFYLTLAENLAGKVPKLELTGPENLRKQLDQFFEQAQKIDYQAVFEADFTDNIEFNASIDKFVYRLVEVFNKFDFKVLPSTVVGNILENLVPSEEKQKFGQYFTPEPLAFLVAFSAIKNRNFVVIDPTSGTGTFLNSFYHILRYLGKHNHQELLEQIWGNDISHFPAVLSVISLYKQKVDDIVNFPRVVRKDYFNLMPNQVVQIPDNKDISKINRVQIPLFDAIISNFPFVQQEDIPNSILTTHFRSEFSRTQNAFLKNTDFDIDERSDYYVYCCYNSLKFLKQDGYLATITSNAWLGKNYGSQFKKFLLDNFTIQYVFKSDAEHWFKNSFASTIFITLKKGVSEDPTRFVTVRFKLEDKIGGNINENLQFIENLYTQIDNCDNPNNGEWYNDSEYETVFHSSKEDLKVSIVPRERLVNSIESQENWAMFFIADNPLSIFESKLINPYKSVYDVRRGTRTGQDSMFIIKQEHVRKKGISSKYLIPLIKNPKGLYSIKYNGKPEYFMLVCHESLEDLEKDDSGTHKWLMKWSREKNKVGKPLIEALKGNKPFWYSMKKETADIAFPINLNERLFFTYFEEETFLNQRLVAIKVNQTYDVKLIAALLNSVISLLIVEFNGVSRNLGALDLNADFFKKKMKMLNPDLLDQKNKEDVLAKFTPLSIREIEPYNSEFKRKDRIEFDTSILKAYGYNPSLLPRLYELLIDAIENRVELKNR
jgi:N-6 DNA Methylase